MPPYLVAHARFTQKNAVATGLAKIVLLST